MKKFFVLSIASILLVACNPEKKPVRASTPIGGRGNPIVGGQGELTVVNTCTQNQFPIGTIYDLGAQQISLYNHGTFEERVKNFLSATVNPQEVGEISREQWDKTGVRFQGVIKLDQNGNVQLAQSKIILKVYDKMIFDSQGAQPIPVSIDKASEGRFDLNTGSGYVVYKDQFGEIRLDGRFDAQNFSGTVSFKNYVSYDQGTPAQGQIGQFLIARCAIIQ